MTSSISAGGTFAGRYTVEHEIGRGGTAIVYLARDLSHGRMVAIKTLRHELTEYLSAERFLREVRLTAALHHPHIVPMLDAGDADGVLYCVMPYMDGGTLRDRLKRDKQLPLSEVVAIGRTIASALASAHERGLIHRDVKPENILFTASQACLADFGIARALVRETGESTTSTGIVRGTPAYMSPEQSSGDHEFDGRSDIYSLGSVLYETIAGVPAFIGPTAHSVLAQRLIHPPRELRVYRPRVPPELVQVIERAMMVAPADRYQTAAELEEALAAVEPALSRPSGTSYPVASEIDPPSPKKWRRPIMAVGIIAAIAVVALWVMRLGPGARAAAALDASRLAVAPFEVIGMPSGEWRDGLVDVLSRNFDGAGPLVSVPASFIIARWERGDRADRASAQRLAERTGAGLVIFGQLVFYDSTRVQLRASIYDAIAKNTIAEPDLTGSDASSVLRLADSLTSITLDVLAKSRAIAGVNRPSLAWPNLEALKAYLRGEQHLRKNEYADALREYQLSIRADPSFALPYRGARRSLRVLKTEFDSTSLAYALEAGARNQRLTARDSLLIVADSLVASCGFRFMFIYDAPCQQRLRRQLASLESAARRYPDDPEVFEELGEERVHLGTFVGQTSEAALAAFTRAITSDPGYAPPYFHATELAGLFGGDSALRIVSAYLRQNPRDTRYRLIAKVLSAAARGRLIEGPALQGEKAADIGDAAYAVRRLPGTLHPADALRRFVAMSTTADDEMRRDARLSLFVNQLTHGQLRAARRSLTLIDASRVPLDVATLAELDTAPADSMRSLMAGWIDRASARATLAVVPWWAATRDTAALKRAAARFQTLVAAATTPTADREVARYGAAAAMFYMVLDAGDTASAVRQGRRLADTPCALYCTPELLTVSMLLRGRGQPDSAAVILDEHPPFVAAFGVVEVLWRLERATVASQRLNGPISAPERTKELKALNDNYLFVVNIWCTADSLLQPAVHKARAGLSAFPVSRRPSC